MTSSVFFKFKSQKEPTRVEFDGTGISVFELKREIITKSGLGDGTDFDLHIYTDDNSEEYDDDTTIIPRSTTVIARRQPALKPGAGRAARYVSGKMPVTAKNAGRKEQAAKASSSKPSSDAISQMNNAMTEEEKMAAMFAAQTEQWSAQQEEMSHQTPVFKAGAKRPANVPDHDPPNGYICYRCGNKGHWIQLCPTNDDPEFDNRPRVKRTTGIPRSFLQKVDKSVVLAQTEGDESKRPSGIMVNAEGDFVIAEPDKASWEQFQAKAKSSSTANAPLAENKEIQEQGLECSIDKKMFIEPMKTPCCQKTFCNDCITNALIESDFVCPACQVFEGQGNGQDSPLPPSPKTLADAKSDGEKQEKSTEETIDNMEQKPENESSDKTKDSPVNEKPKSPVSQTATVNSPPAGPKNLVSASQDTNKQLDNLKPADTSSKKRPADDILDNPRIPKGPKAMQNQQNQQNMNGNFGQGAGADEDAYFRKPVNPHRHQNKQRRVRPSDYREL
ncbi:hypothetical protein RAB80_003138 [Fusarium oxysporum f. sp. vasinfectum]|nr:hypothetical protein RAB80_003138 [Fusarium oxysporum f. sp. vasinfectum]